MVVEDARVVTFCRNENIMVDPYYANTASAMACLYRNTGFSTFSLIFHLKQAGEKWV